MYAIRSYYAQSAFDSKSDNGYLNNIFEDIAQDFIYTDPRITSYNVCYTKLLRLKCYRSGIIPSNDNVTGGKMTTEEQMTIEERYKYLRMMKARYVRNNFV